jgi:hypothetical protein
MGVFVLLVVRESWILSDASNLITLTTSGRRSEASYLPSRYEDIDLK